MRLLNVVSQELAEFWDSEVPRYGILSHTWEKEEVSFQDMQNGNGKNKAGYAKILGCCRQAVLDQLEYVWIDTCCIDKSSSAELTEAINSMYQWYQRAWVCYAYLSDVASTNGLNSGLRDEVLSRSRWFTRGWTLQELIAPRQLEIYSANWDLIGRKTELTSQLSVITGVPGEVLRNSLRVRFASVAARMSWASRRVTTRKEDIAYCLMGIFGVNMPLLYGEGDWAFNRLQQEIIKISTDHSLFAWVNSPTQIFSGMLASSPFCFSKSRYIVETLGPGRGRPSTITNCGLQIELALVGPTEGQGPVNLSHMGNYIAILDCVDTRRLHYPIGIKLGLRGTSDQKSYYRVDTANLWTVSDTRLNPTGIQVHSEVLHVSEGVPVGRFVSVYKWNSGTSKVSESFVLHDVHPVDKWVRCQF